MLFSLFDSESMALRNALSSQILKPTGDFRLIYSLVECISGHTQNSFEKKKAEKMVNVRGYFLKYYFRYENKI